ncbi:hypothetical protein LIER_17866 [Lithospermum erythrorhizon]|uniref:Reverse transcriptase Ty1/copia-type domain-containing protein n=1 Tax=Lithospermum erythrorhizon TaxID=34254 RepID=A0AAV3QF60_LITER
MGKQHSGSFKNTGSRQNEMLQLVYSEVCDPMKVKILEGCSYFVTFIDDFLRKSSQQAAQEITEDVEQQDMQLGNTTQAITTSSRIRIPFTRYSETEYTPHSDRRESLFYHEAMESDDKLEWLQAMKEEMSSLYKNNTYILVKRIPRKKLLKIKWIYKLKFEEGKEKRRYKVRLVVKCFEQKYGVDYDEIFSPVVKMVSIRLILGLKASQDLELEQLDVKTSFLHG